MEQIEILVKSTLDGTMQPSLFYEAKEKNRPLLIGLHTWSFDRFNQVGKMTPFAEEQDFNLLLPEFRGKNLAGNPECTKACGSDFAVQDIIDAVNYVVENYEIDKNNIFVLGASGGGMMALLLAGRHPDMFKAVAAFVPICDLSTWKPKSYVGHVLACCGSEEEMLHRSPITYIDGIAKGTVKIFHGKFDPVVPKEQSINLYMKILEKHPDAKVYLDIFDGKHEIDMNVATYWILKQYKKVENVAVTG